MANQVRDPRALSTPELIYRAADVLSITGIALDRALADALYVRGDRLDDIGNETVNAPEIS